MRGAPPPPRRTMSTRSPRSSARTTSTTSTRPIAFQLSGWYPKRAAGTSPDFPVRGTGEYDWQGFDPGRHTMDVVGLDQRPHATDQAYLVSWNNKQASGWAAADDKLSYGPVFRS